MLIYAKFLIIKPSFLCVANVATILSNVPTHYQNDGDNHESKNILDMKYFCCDSQ